MVEPDALWSLNSITRRILSAERLHKILNEYDPDFEEVLGDYIEEFRRLNYWFNIDRFDRRTANRKLKERFLAQMEKEVQ